MALSLNPWALSHAGRFAVTHGRRSRRDHSAAWGLLHAALVGPLNAALLLLLALVVICVLPAQGHAVPMLSAEANGSVGVAFERQLVGADFTPVTVTQNPTPTGITLSANGFSLLNNAPIPGTTGLFWVGSAAASATVVVGFGTLGAQAFAGEVLTPITVGSPQLPPVLTNPYNAAASIGAAGGVQDSFTLYDPSLPLGAPVVFLLTSNTDANMSGTFDPFTTDAIAVPTVVATGSFGTTGLFGSNVCIGGHPGQCLFESGQTLGSIEQVTGQNGEVVSLFYSLGVGVTPNPLGTAYDPTSLGPREATVDALNTMTVNIDPVTDGLSITSASGYNYSTLAPPPPCGVPGAPACPPQGVPEPPGLVLLGIGLAGLAGRAWRRARRM